MAKLSTLLLAPFLLLAPAAFAGTADAPEIEDEIEGHKPALDVHSAWFTSLDPRWPDRADRQLRITIKLADLGAVAPAADGADDETRYYYDITFTHDPTGRTYTVVCYVHLVDVLLLPNPVGAGNYGISGDCYNAMDGNAVALAVTPSFWIPDDTLTVTLSRPYNGGITLAPGTTISGISIATAGGKATSTAGPATGQIPHGPTVDTAGTASFTM